MDLRLNICHRIISHLLLIIFVFRVISGQIPEFQFSIFFFHAIRASISADCSAGDNATGSNAGSAASTATATDERIAHFHVVDARGHVIRSHVVSLWRVDAGPVIIIEDFRVRVRRCPMVTLFVSVVKRGLMRRRGEVTAGGGIWKER